MNFLKFCISIIISLVLGSCSWFSQKYCKNLDWYEQGKIDGSKGKGASGYAQHALSCGLKPDKEAYQKGREDGLSAFCNRQNAFELGKQGAPYLGQCSGRPDEYDFKDGHSWGKRIYRQIDEIHDLERDLENSKFSTTRGTGNNIELNEQFNEVKLLEKELKFEKSILKQLIERAKAAGLN